MPGGRLATAFPVRHQLWYACEVAQVAKAAAASPARELAGIARAQNTAEAPLSVTSRGRRRKPVASATLLWLLSDDERTGDAGVRPDRALAAVEQRRVLVESVAGGAGRAVPLEVETQVESLLPFAAAEFGLPCSSNQRAPKALARVPINAMFSPPAGLAAQADTVLALVGRLSLAANSPSWVQVGCSGIRSPACWNRSLRCR